MTVNPPVEVCALFQDGPTENKTIKSKMADQSRMASFFSYPYPSAVGAFKLAAAGFNYEGKDDEVICRHCGLRYSGWRKGDDPKSIHLEKSPKCAFFQPSLPEGEEGQLTGACGGPIGTVGLQDSNQTEAVKETPKPTNELESSVDISTVHNQSGIDSDQNMHHAVTQSGISNPVHDQATQVEQHQARNSSSPETRVPSDETQTVEVGDQSCRGNLSNTSHDSVSHTRTNETSTGAVETVPPKYRQFSVLATRLNSYRNWPKHLKQRPEDLAKAGLFYEGTNDYVRCFHCAGGLREWDPEDDPFYEHARWFPFCPFLRLLKGDNFVMGVQSGAIKPPEIQHESGQEITTFEHPAVLSVMELGYKKGILAKAVTMYKKRHGKDLCAEKLLPIVWEIEENNDIEVIPEDDVTETKQTDHNDEEDTCESTGEDTELTKEAGTTHTKDIDELTEENRELREQKTCKVCLDEEASIVFLPCGHLVTCPMCASALRKCPVCRTYIRGTVKAIIS